MKTDVKTYLFVDDHHILYRSGTERFVTPFTRHADNPVVPAREHPWEGALAWSSIYRNPETGGYQLWYQSFTGDQLPERTQDCAVCCAESDDGVVFRKPMMDTMAFGTFDSTNIVMVGNGGYSYRYGNYVVVDPNPTDPERRYKMAYFDFSGEGADEFPGLCVAFSPDGKIWNKHPVGPLSRIAYGRGGFGTPVPFADDDGEPWNIPLSMSDALDVMYDPELDRYVIYGKMWIDGPDGGMYWKHGIGRIESRDFLKWSTPELVMWPDDRDASHVEFHTAPVFYHSDCYFALTQILDRATGGGVIDIELMVSRDGRSWNRPFRDDYVPGRSEAGAFDSGSIFTNATPVILNDEIRFYYGAYSGGATSADDRGHNSGVGLATIVRDRFAGIRPVALSDQPTLVTSLRHVGQVTMRPITLSPDHCLSLNADASSGRIRVELLNPDGTRIRGFSVDRCREITGDNIAHPVSWLGRDDCCPPPGEYMLRIHLDHSTVYAADHRTCCPGR